MKKLALLSLLLAACASTPSKPEAPKPTPPDDGCSFNFPEMQSGLGQDAKKFAALSPVERDEGKKVLRQSAKLLSGEKVEFAGGGCAHFAYSFTYSGIRRGPNSLKTALGLLQKTPLNSDRMDYAKVLIDALREAEKNPRKSGSSWILPCGDARCALENLGHGRLRVSYDFAL
jgi:hypothetical protein